jgi:hypothetical protein
MSKHDDRISMRHMLDQAREACAMAHDGTENQTLHLTAMLLRSIAVR